MKYFGTDGIRDKVDGPLLQPDQVYFVGRAAGKWLSRGHTSGSPHVLIGRDTRTSGEQIFNELAKGLSAEGVKVFDGAICPTPAIAHAVRTLDLEGGLVITASHNPATDNGIKIFGKGGQKLTEADELKIEELIDQFAEQGRSRSSPPAVLQYDARRHYIDFNSRILEEQSLFGLRVVVDSANGSTYRTTAEVLTHYGATVQSVGAEPNGQNINCGFGSEFPDKVAKSVLRNGADIGIAHDGDGDRVILADRFGNIIDGDAVLAILGTGWARRAELPHNTVVSTIMSNLGLDRALATEGVKLERTAVGDRNVFHRMRDNGYILGGESSGHFIAMRHLPTGDGLLAALLVLREMILSGRSLHELAAVFQPFPQIKKNLPVLAKPDLTEVPNLTDAIAAIEDSMAGKGRLLLRYSGTESKIRLLVEAEDHALAQSAFEVLESRVHQLLPISASI